LPSSLPRGLFALLPQFSYAQGFDKINTTVTNVNTILVT
jgi:hypothetical protein